MSELPDVQPGEIIESAHINDIADRTIQRYADAADLATKNPTPQQGEGAYLLDTDIVQWFDGVVWTTVFLPLTGGTISGTFNAEGADGISIRANSPLLDFRSPDGSTANRWAMFRQADEFHLFSNTLNFDVLHFDQTFARIRQVWEQTTGSAANVTVFDPGTLFRSTSARKYKSNIQPAPHLADVVLEPVTFHHDGDDTDYVGFIADDIAAQVHDAGIYTEAGEIDNYDVRAVVAILTAKVNDLTARLAALES